MKKKLNRISALFLAVLTAMLTILAMPAKTASAEVLPQYYLYANSGQTYQFALNATRPYMRFTINSTQTVRFYAETYGVDSMFSSVGTYYYVYDSNGKQKNYWFHSCSNNSRVTVLDNTMTLNPGTYYLYQAPMNNGSWGPSSYTRSRITYNGSSVNPNPNPQPVYAYSPRIYRISTGNHKAWIYFDRVTGATSYSVYVIQGGRERRAGVTKNNKFLVTGMTNGVRAYYYVKATVNGRLTTQKYQAYSTPRYPVNPNIYVTDNDAHLSWSRYSGATKYKIHVVDRNYNLLATRETRGTSFNWYNLGRGQTYGFYVVPYVNGEYIPFGRSHSDDRSYIYWRTIYY